MTDFSDAMLLAQGLEFRAVLPDGNTVHYLSRDAAEAYRDHRGAAIIAPMQGPKMPECFAALR